MEVRIESMICVWDDAIPTMFLEFVNLLTLTTSEGELRKSVKEFAEKHERSRRYCVNCTPFVRQYGILSNKWGVLLCQKEYQTNDIRRNSKNW